MTVSGPRWLLPLPEGRLFVCSLTMKAVLDIQGGNSRKNPPCGRKRLYDRLHFCLCKHEILMPHIFWQLLYFLSPLAV